MFSYFDDVVLAAKEQPQHLVAAVRIVIAQDVTRSLLPNRVLPSYRDMAVERLEASIELAFEPLLTSAAHVSLSLFFKIEVNAFWIL